MFIRDSTRGERPADGAIGLRLDDVLSVDTLRGVGRQRQAFRRYRQIDRRDRLIPDLYQLEDRLVLPRREYRSREREAATHLAPNRQRAVDRLSLIHISEPTRLGMISYAVFCL